MTAALNRAIEELEETDLGFEHSRRQIRPIAHQVLSAALTDPDDPDWLARLFLTTSPAYLLHVAWDDMPRSVQARYREQAAAVRAAILGDAS